MVGRNSVVRLAVAGLWIRVDSGCGQPPNAMQKFVLRVIGDPVGRDDRRGRVDLDLALCAKGVTNPAQSDLADAKHSRCV